MKKLVHLADLHLGATLHGRERLPEQRHFLNWLCGCLAAESPRADLLVVAGDVFDGHVPSPAARTVWYDFLARVRAPEDPLAGAVVVIAGNHDSAPALRCAGELARHSGIRIVADGPSFEEDEAFAVPCADGGALAIAAMPHLREARLRRDAPPGTAPADSLEAGFRAHYSSAAERARAAAPAGSPLVLVAHCAVQGSRVLDAPGTELRVVGNMVEIPASALPAADYTALGHLHIPQAVATLQGNAFYAGSPYPVGTGELVTPKSVPFVTIGDDGTVLADPRIVDLAVLRPLRAFEGTTEDIVRDAKDFVLRHPGTDSPDNPAASAWFTATITGGEGSLQELERKLENVVEGTGAAFFGLREGRERMIGAALPAFDPATFARLDPEGVAKLRFDAASLSLDRQSELLALVRQAASAIPAAPAPEPETPAAGAPSRILSVDFSNLNRLRGHARIDFEALRAAGGSFAVAGDTGAGKTTILDAVTLALFGQTARQEDAITAKSNQVMSHGAKFCRAAVLFRGHDNRLYRAVWAQGRKPRKGDVDDYRHELWDVTDPAAPKMVHGGGDSQKCAPKVSERLGFTYEEFSHIVLLSQGRFDQFLKANEETRAAILEKVTDSPHFSLVGAEINRRKGEAAAELDARRAVASSTLEELRRMGCRDALETAKAQADDLAAQAEADARKLRDELDWTRASDKLDADRKTFEEDSATHDKNMADFATDGIRLGNARRANALEKDWGALALAEQGEQSLEGQLKDLGAKIAEGEAALPGLREADAEAKSAFAAAQKALDDRKAFLDDIDRRDLDIAEKLAKARNLAALAKSGKDAADNAETSLENASRNAKVAGERAVAAEMFWRNGTAPAAGFADEPLFKTIAAARDAQNRIASAVAPITGLEATAETMEKAHGNAKSAADTASDAWTKERNGLEILRDLAVLSEGESAENMRKHLVEGRPCPVCGSIHHGKTVSVGLPPSADYRRRIDEGDTRVQSLRTTESEALRAKTRAGKALDDARRRLENVREEAQNNISAAMTGVAAARQEADTLADGLAQFKRNAEDAAEKAKRATATADKAVEELAAARKARQDLYGSGKPQDERDGLNEQRAQAQTRAARIAEKGKAAEKALEANKKDREVKSNELAETRRTCEMLRAAFAKKRADAGFASDEDWKSARLSPGDMRSLEARERELRDESVRLFGPDGHGGERKRLADEAARLDRDKHKPVARRTLLDLESDLLSAENSRRETAAAAGSAKTTLDAFCCLEQKAAADKAALEPIENKARDWDVLDKMLGGQDGKLFRLFAQRLNFRNLVLAADPHLQAVSGKRYRFAWSSEGVSLTESGRLRTESLQVIDAEQDGTRPVSTLSGGESFFASLALALGFSSLRGCGACENLFLDEGFGTLDAQSLDAAVEVIDRIGSQGTLVGVVTHIDGVVGHVDSVVEAVANGDGTSFLRGGVGVEWSADPGRPPTKTNADGKDPATSS